MSDKNTPGWQCLLRGQERFYTGDKKNGLMLGELQAEEVDKEIAKLTAEVERLQLIESLLLQTIEMNEAPYFWGYLARMPVTKFIGPLRKALEGE